MTVSSKGKVMGADLVIEGQEEGTSVVLIDCGTCCYNVDNGCRIDPPTAVFLPQEQAVAGPGAPTMRLVPVSVFPPVRLGLTGCSRGIKHKIAPVEQMPLGEETKKKLVVLTGHEATDPRN